MRIVGGEWKGRRLAAPAGSGTRPTSDRVREALFSMLVSELGTGLGGCDVLDVFAGTGALGLEALSRGCAKATFVERERRALHVLSANVEAVGAGERVAIVSGDVSRIARSGQLKDTSAGLLFLDPPYRIGAADVARVLVEIAESGALAEGALIVWEHDSRTEPEWPHQFRRAATRSYGTTTIDLATFERGRPS